MNKFNKTAVLLFLSSMGLVLYKSLDAMERQNTLTPEESAIAQDAREHSTTATTRFEQRQCRHTPANPDRSFMGTLRRAGVRAEPKLREIRQRGKRREFITGEEQLRNDEMDKEANFRKEMEQKHRAFIADTPFREERASSRRLAEAGEAENKRRREIARKK